MSPKPIWPREKAYEWVKLQKVVAIVRTRNAQQARGTIEALIKGGFKLIEVAMTMMGPTDVIREFSGRSGILVGAGSVLSVKMAQTALDAGAQFIMTPHTDTDVLKLVKRSKQLYLCGALTPTEAVRAWTMGADMIRLFPARALGGAPYVQALKELLQDVPLIPSGGVTLDNLRDYFLAGATAVGASGALMNEQAVENGRWPEITAQAKRFQEVLQKL